ncbi:uncharacterized protein LOC127575211 [Pristis pectinata]|uniref:uncharacterized protein LOC127575211 n=1 Tax=Pristis pectinata TaxID=685728 RepID=UPI00223E24DE|nr:uncharacterized protein LOC127575211 [Pristis pectinata]
MAPPLSGGISSGRRAPRTLARGSAPPPSAAVTCSAPTCLGHPYRRTVLSCAALPGVMEGSPAAAASSNPVISVLKANVRRTFKRVNPCKASGPDSVPVQVLKTRADQLAGVFDLSLLQSDNGLEASPERGGQVICLFLTSQQRSHKHIRGSGPPGGRNWKRTPAPEVRRHPGGSPLTSASAEPLRATVPSRRRNPNPGPVHVTAGLELGIPNPNPEDVTGRELPDPAGVNEATRRSIPSMLARSHFARLLAKCQREDLDTSRALRRFSDLLLLQESGRKWSCCIGSIALLTRRHRSLHPTFGRERFAINLPELEGERPAHLGPTAWIPYNPFVEQRSFKCFGENLESWVALSQRVTRAESFSKCKCFKSTNYLESICIFNYLNFLRHRSVLLQRELTATVFKLRETNVRCSATDFLHSLSVGSMETLRAKTLEEDHCSMSMECDQQTIEELQSVITPDSDIVSAKDSPDNTDRLFSDVDIAELLGNDVPEGTQKAEDGKKKRPKVGKRKKNQSAAEKEVNSLLAELPFPNAKIREEYGCQLLPKYILRVTKAPVKNSKKKRKRTLGGENDEDTGQIKKKKVRPNYFVSIPITNPKIIGGIKAVQDLVVQTDERLSKAMIPISCLHITVLVTYLASDVEVNKAVSTIEECKEPVQEILLGEQLALGFHGIADFRGEVVFAQLVENEQLTTLIHIAETIKKRFQANGILTGDSRAFKPHLTFMKLSRAPKLHHQGIKKISPELYKNFKNHYFGDEVVTCLHLCSMLKKKQPNGYYHCETSLAVGEKNESEPDEEELVSLSKRLVETAVIKAVQQYLEETQSKAKQNTNGQKISSKWFKDTDPNNGNKK